MRRKKILLGSIIGVAVIGTIAVLTYFFIFSADVKRVVALGDTTYKVGNFSKSKMEFFDTGTFQVEIIYTANGTDQIFFVGIGTYEKKSNRYELTFTQAIGFNNNSFTDVTNLMNQNKRHSISRGRIMFADHNNQIYYFR